MNLRFGILLLATLLAQFSVRSLRADVVAVGDTDPSPVNISDAGGDVGGDLVIGVDGVGGLFMDIAPPLSGTLEPLESTNGILGEGIDAIGAAVFDDLGVSWRIDNILSVGLEGQGFLDVFQSASVQVGFDPNSGTSTGAGIVFLGEELTGQGIVTLNDRGTRLATAELTVGNFGVGQIDLIGGGNLISEDSWIGRENGGLGEVTVTGMGSRWDLRGALNVGNDVSGEGTLLIADRGLVQANEDATVTVNRLGIIDLAGGTLRQIDDPFSFTTPIVNGGVIRGDGTIQGALEITGQGELRNAASVANLREYLRVSGPVINNGTIVSQGGEMEFQSPVENNLELVARDAIMHFLNDPNAPGLDNSGAFVMGGDTTVHGAIVTSPGGSLSVLTGSEALVVGDLFFSASSFLSLGIGPSAGTLDVVGTADITDSILLLDYSAGLQSQPGDTYQIFSSTGGIMGMFTNTQAIADGRLWNIFNDGSTITVTATGVAAAPMGADFNGDGIVDAADLAIWDANYGLTGAAGLLGTLGDADGDGDVDGSDFLEIQMKFGGPPLVAAVAAVPEPSALVLALTALALMRRRRIG